MIFREHRAKDRYVAAVVAQTAGLSILVLIYFVFSRGPAEIALGVNCIWWATALYVSASAVIAVFPFVTAVRKKKRVALDHDSADSTIIPFVALDIAILLFLVCQEGGLCRSMFLPVYFLIPLAYVSLERPGRLRRALTVVIIIVVCILLSFVESWRAWPPRLETTMLLLPIPVTDFHKLDHSHFDWAILWVSLISACIPVVEIGTILFRTRNITETVARTH